MCRLIPDTTTVSIPEDVSFLTLKTEEATENGEPSSPMPTLESVVSLVTASTTDATVAALAAVQEAAESSNKGVCDCLCSQTTDTLKLFQFQSHKT